MAQWMRAGPITQRSEDQNLALLNIVFILYGRDVKPTLFVNFLLESLISEGHESRENFFFFYVLARKEVFTFYSDKKEHFM